MICVNIFYHLFLSDDYIAEKGFRESYLHSSILTCTSLIAKSFAKVISQSVLNHNKMFHVLSISKEVYRKDHRNRSILEKISNIILAFSRGSHSYIVCISCLYNDFPYQKSILLHISPCHYTNFNRKLAGIRVTQLAGSCPQVFLSLSATQIVPRLPKSSLFKVWCTSGCLGHYPSTLYPCTLVFASLLPVEGEKKISPSEGQAVIFFCKIVICVPGAGKLHNTSCSKKSFMFSQFSSVVRKTSHGSHLFYCFGQAG